jgi:iron complex outermembrane receptor protein
VQLTAKRKERGAELNGLQRQQVAAAWAAGLASVGVAAAQPVDEETRIGTLSEVVVSATREEASIATIPGSVTVVTRETIEREARSGKNLGDILGERVPGLAPGSDTISNTSARRCGAVAFRC